jgi:hypothetical protein
MNCVTTTTYYCWGCDLPRRISGSVSRSETRPDRGRLPFCGSGPSLAQRHIKQRQAGAREPTFTVPAAPPQTLTLRPIKEAPKRGDWHHPASATDRRLDGLRHHPTTGAPSPTDDLRHVFVLITPRYSLVVPRL